MSMYIIGRWSELAQVVSMTVVSQLNKPGYEVWFCCDPWTSGTKSAQVERWSILRQERATSNQDKVMEGS